MIKRRTRKPPKKAPRPRKGAKRKTGKPTVLTTEAGEPITTEAGNALAIEVAPPAAITNLSAKLDPAVPPFRPAGTGPEVPHPASYAQQGTIDPNYLHRRPIAAVLSPGEDIIAPLRTGSTPPPAVLLATSPILIPPTIYPPEPSGAVAVENHITINIHSADFREFTAKIDELTAELRRSNQIAGEVRDQLIAETAAGIAALKAPKANRKLIDLLLWTPLKYIAEKGAGAMIGYLATESPSE